MERTMPVCTQTAAINIMNTSSHSSWISPLATAGYAAKGVVYAIIGVLAAMSAFGSGGSINSSEGALQEIRMASLGGILLIIVGIGLLAYGIYRLLGAFADIESEGNDETGVAKRLGYFGSGLSYCGLAIAAFGGLGGGGEKSLTAKVLAMPFGAWLVGLLGAAIIVAGLQQWVKAITGKYASKFSLDRYTADKRKWIERIAKLGLAARGIVFPIIGFFLIRAAMQGDASETTGIGGALVTLAQQDYGTLLLGITATGLACYGIYCWVLAIYGRWHQFSK